MQGVLRVDGLRVGRYTDFGNDRVLHQRIRRLADVHLSRFPGGFHARCRVHRIAPDVVLELLHAHDARDDGAGSNTVVAYATST